MVNPASSLDQSSPHEKIKEHDLSVIYAGIFINKNAYAEMSINACKE